MRAARRSSTRPCPAGSPRPPGGPSPASTTISRAARQARRTPPTGPIMKSDGRLPVAIVGGGFSGRSWRPACAARYLGPDRWQRPRRTGRRLFDHRTGASAQRPRRRDERVGRRSRPFRQGFEAEGGDRRGFAERRLFGRYLREILDHAVGLATPRSNRRPRSVRAARAGRGTSTSTTGGACRRRVGAGNRQPGAGAAACVR